MGLGLKAKVQVPEEEVAVEGEVEVSAAEMAAAIESAVPVQETKDQAQVPEVKKEAPAPAVVIPGTVPSLESLSNKWDTDEVGNVFPRVVGTNGALYIDTLTLGEFADVQVYSHNARTMVVPISAIDKDPRVKRFCRASYDHKTNYDRESGTNISIEEYAESIKGEFPKGVKVSKYHDVFCTIFNCNKNVDAAKAKAIVQFSISPTAIKDWYAFVKTTKFRVLQGAMLASHQNCVRMVADPRNKDGQNYVAVIFQPVPLDVLATYTPILE